MAARLTEASHGCGRRATTEMLKRGDEHGRYLIDLGIASIVTCGGELGTRMDPVPIVVPKIYPHSRNPD